MTSMVFTREFDCKSTTADERDEVRLSDEKSQSNILLRHTKGVFKRGARYEISVREIEPAPDEPTILAEVPASDAGSLPGSAEIVKPKSKAR